MNYEQRYKEALDRAKKLKENSDSTAVINGCEQIFPELQGNEDEKMRKWIIDVIRYHMNYNLKNETTLHLEYKKKSEKAITWLEKQGKQKPVEDSLTLEEFENAFITKAEQYDIDLPNRSWDIYALCKELYSLKHKLKQGEQKPVDKVEPKFHEGEWITIKE